MLHICASALEEVWRVPQRSADITQRCWELLGQDGWYGASLDSPAEKLMEMGEAGVLTVLRGLLFEGSIRGACMRALEEQGAAQLEFLSAQLAAGRQTPGLQSVDVGALAALEEVILKLSGLNSGTPSLDTPLRDS